VINPKSPETIQKMFDRLAPRYDTINTVLSLGIHRYWKRKLVSLGIAGLSARGSILDCATGTGDIAELWSQRLGPQFEVIATDFSVGMLEKAKTRHQGSRLKFQVADVEQLPFASANFDRASISFGIRNVSNPVRALQELARVVRPGGKVLVLEFGQPTIPGYAGLYSFYSNRILPMIGGLLSGERSAYQYLNESSAKFPSGKMFMDLAWSTSAFSKVHCVPLAGGIAWIYLLSVASET
jgi:demethylmenaquinone methyltransferase/2-methoxy-6-polyprenyl-1,4-benzoquinol methylase